MCIYIYIGREIYTHVSYIVPRLPKNGSCAALHCLWGLAPHRTETVGSAFNAFALYNNSNNKYNNN